MLYFDNCYFFLLPIRIRLNIYTIRVKIIKLCPPINGDVNNVAIIPYVDPIKQFKGENWNANSHICAN